MIQILLNNTWTWYRLFWLLQIIRRSKDQGLRLFNGPTFIKYSVNKGEMFCGRRRRSSRSAYYRLLQRSLEEISRSSRSLRNGSKRIADALEPSFENPNIAFESSREGIFPQNTAFVLRSICSSADLVSVNVPTTANVMKQEAKSTNFFGTRFKNLETIVFRYYYYQYILRSYRLSQNEQLYFVTLNVCIDFTIFHIMVWMFMCTLYYICKFFIYVY